MADIEPREWHSLDLPPVAPQDRREDLSTHRAISRALEAQSDDMVNAPPHYRQGAVECIDALEAALGPDGFRAYCRGAAIKYLWRAPHKGNAAEDYRKARWYLDRLIGATP